MLYETPPKMNPVAVVKISQWIILVTYREAIYFAY
jgi:hypothetical protein